MPIQASEATSLVGTYDQWAIAEFRTFNDGCVAYGKDTTDPVRLLVRLVKYRVREDGKAERSPLPADTRQFEIADLYAEAQVNPDIANVLMSLTVSVATYAANQGML